MYLLYLLSRKYLECEQCEEPEIGWHGNIIISLLLEVAHLPHHPPVYIEYQYDENRQVTEQMQKVPDGINSVVSAFSSRH